MSGCSLDPNKSAPLDGCKATMEKMSISFDIHRFRKLKPNEERIGMCNSADGRYYLVVKNDKGLEYLIPTCSDKEWKQIKKKG